MPDVAASDGSFSGLIGSLETSIFDTLFFIKLRAWEFLSKGLPEGLILVIDIISQNRLNTTMKIMKCVIF